MEIVFMFIHYTVAGPSTEGVIMLLPIIAGGAGTYEMSIPVLCAPFTRGRVLLVLVIVVVTLLSLLRLSRNASIC